MFERDSGTQHAIERCSSGTNNEEQADHEGSATETKPVTPLPYPQILALCLGRIAEGMMFTVILPYINQMVHLMGVKEENVGRWSAAAVCLLSWPFG